MAEIISTGTAGSALATDITPAGDSLPPNQPQPIPDRLAAILLKKDSGGTLTASERGFLGATKRKGIRAAAPAKSRQNVLFEASPISQPTPSSSPPVAGNPLFEAAHADEASADSLAGVPIDSTLLRSAATAILDSMDTATKLYIGHIAANAGADPATVAAYKSAVALQAGNRELMVENSQPLVLMLCKMFNCSPDKLADVLKNCGFIAGLAAHVTAVFAVAKSIRESRAQRSQQP